MKADYPLRFVNSLVKEFHISEDCGDESFIIPPSLLKLQNLSYPLKYHTVNSMNLSQNIFLKNFCKFTNNGIGF